MTIPVRTRFAPSPTGHLHIGSVRTALYAWLFARKHAGTFILRIEDTDLERSKPEYVDGILAGMQWLELGWEQGPIFQTHRTARYLQVAQQLFEQGQAYYCSCSQERLNQVRENQLAVKQKPKYDGHCRNMQLEPLDPKDPKALSRVLRFKNPQDGLVTINDVVYGDINIHNQELDDLVLLRSDGSPTYNFTVVVDDLDMQITHVIRGDDHINNTPKQINLFKALGANLPIYAHIPMILGPDGQKLSKRHGAQDILSYRAQGYLPEALLNYLLRLGWSHGDQEIFSRDEMIANFNLESIHRSPAALNPDKLNWLNQHYLKPCAFSDIQNQLLDVADALGLALRKSPEKLEAIWQYQKERSKTLVELLQQSQFVWQAPDPAQITLNAEQIAVLVDFMAVLKTVEASHWQPEHLKSLIADFLKNQNLKMPALGIPLRLALTGTTVSPALDITLFLIGQEASLARLEICNYI
ncbi:MAG: glutamate--tRNA ligase [Gammaproteobacteria bacterium]